jgi:predicted nuclease with RNAse H fold
MMTKYAVTGIDLAGVSHRPTGICFLRELDAETILLYSNQDIMRAVERENPSLVTIDAPLSLPPGRKTIQQKNGQHFRPCDLELRRRNIPFFPITLGPMRGLTERGIGLKGEIEKMGIPVVEIYPGGAQDIWGIPRVKRSLRKLREGLGLLGILGLREDCSSHELDAATAALVGRLYLKGAAEIYGDFSSGAIVMPRAVGVIPNLSDPRNELSE